MAITGMHNKAGQTFTSVGLPIDPIAQTEVPKNYITGAFFDVRVKFKFPVLGWHQDNTREIWVFDGADLDLPQVYVWNSSSPPDFSDTLPKHLDDTDWVKLSRPAQEQLNARGEWFDADGNWSGDYGIYNLMRFGPIPEGTHGIWTGRLREGALYSAHLGENEPEHYVVS